MLLPRRDVPALSVLTQNIRMARSETAPGDPDHWGDRAPILGDLLRSAEADVVATQEVTWPQLPVLEEALGETHLRLGMGREGGARGEHSLLHLRRDRFAILDWDQFWLSEQPSLIGSMGWDAHCPRIAVWARVLDRATDAELVFACTHLDHAGPRAQREGAALIARRLTEAASRAGTAAAGPAGHQAGAPIVLMGDFNATAGASDPWRTLVEAGLGDAHEEAVQRHGEDIGTFPDYGHAVPGGERIDWIMTRGLQVEAYAAHDHVLGGVHASDHAAVQATLRIPGADTRP